MAVSGELIIPAELSANLKSLPKSRGQRLASLTDWAFVRLLDRGIDAIGIDNIVKTVLAAYDQYIVPMDLPVLTEGQEATFDASVKIGLDLAIRGLHDFIHAKAEGRMMGAAPRVWIGEAA